MRSLIFVAVLATSVSSLSFLEKAQGYLSGNASASGSASSSSGSGSNFFDRLQNSSFGQTLISGYNNYTQSKNGNGSNIFDTDYIQQKLGNSSLGVAVNSGIEFYNGIKNGDSPFDSDASSIIGSFVPFLANASSEARAEFYGILPNVGNMTINQFETAVDQWAKKYNLTEEVEAFNKRSENRTAAAEEHANSVVMNLPNVLNNLKAISSDKDQTVAQMHTRMMDYVNSLDDDTQDIVFIFFKNLLPPQFSKPRCANSGSFLSDIYQKATEYFGGQNGTNGGSKQGSGNTIGFGSVGSFWSSFSGNGNGNGNGGSGNEKPHPMMGILSNFMNKNNISDQQASAAMNGAQHDGGFASIQILPAVNLNTGEGALASDAQIGLAVIDPIQTQTTKKNKKQQQANNKKKTTTVAPANDNLAMEVHAQIL